MITTVWMGFIGFVDDYIKVFKKDKGGLSGKFKVLGQVGLGLIVGSMLYFHPDVTIKEQLPVEQQIVQKNGRKLQNYLRRKRTNQQKQPFPL